MIRLDTASEIPLYRQLYDHFTTQIESGHLESGERLPATRELAGQLGLNRTTVSAAYELLESNGWISGEVGRGSFVRSRHAESARKPLNWNELLKLGSFRRNPGTGVGSFISFATSRPSEQLFPLDAFRQSCREVLESPELPVILQLGSPGGYEPLRQYLLEQARTEGIARASDDIIITSGCQQALDLIRSVLVRPGDAVAIEDPVYPGLKNLFQEGGAELLGVPVGPNGLDVDQLHRLRPKMVIATPTFQNPTGATIPVEARRRLLQLPGAVIVENDIYSDLRYEGQTLPTLKQLDETGDVILLRSFSKIAFPGLRVGWIIAPRPVIQRLTEAKQLSDLHTDQFSQAVLLQFARSGRLGDHQAHMLRTGSDRLTAVLHACAQFLPVETRFSKPQGGMNLWVELPAFLDSGDLLARAQAAGVTYLPGRHFAVSRDHSSALRLSFAGLTEAEIQKGLAALGQVFSEALEAEPATAMV